MSNSNKSVEYELDTKQCAKVALFMYKEWEKAMEPPLFVYKKFPEWLEELLKKERNDD